MIDEQAGIRQEHCSMYRPNIASSLCVRCSKGGWPATQSTPSGSAPAIIHVLSLTPTSQEMPKGFNSGLLKCDLLKKCKLVTSIKQLKGQTNIITPHHPRSHICLSKELFIISRLGNTFLSLEPLKNISDLPSREFVKRLYVIACCSYRLYPN